MLKFQLMTATATKSVARKYAAKDFRKGHRQGAALILTLLFLVLFTVIIIAFLRKALLNRQIAFSSSGQERAMEVEQSAEQIIIADLRVEMYNGSTVAFDANGTNAVLTPNAAAGMVPYRLPGATENLVAWSSNLPLWPNQAPYTAVGPTRSYGNTSTTSASANGRYIDLPTWNRPQFLTSYPAAATPQWCLLTRAGPVNGATPPPVSLLGDNVPTNKSYVVGRYAYALYDEGACLDVAAAGYSTAVAQDAEGPGVLGRKGVAAYADLTQLGLTQAQVDNLVTWRNKTSAASLSAYTNYVSGDGSKNGFLHADPAQGQTFISRQDLIDFWTTNVTADTTALKYLTTFSREKNAPSWAPAIDASGLNGSNDGYQIRNVDPTTSTAAPNIYAYKTNENAATSINRFLPQVRVTTAFTRLDGTQALVGEPLIKSRFDLNKLAWISHDGSLPGGVTSSDVLNYFGLTYSNTTGVYTYDHTGAGDVGAGTRIMTLDEVATAGREPDFFELLQAGLLQGSLGTLLAQPGQEKDYSVYSELGTYWARKLQQRSGTPVYRNDKDSNLTYAQEKYQVIQIGSNIIDQAGTSNYPTEISLNDEHFYGIKNLPYFNAVGASVLRPTKDGKPPGVEIFSNPTLSGVLGTTYSSWVHSWMTFSLWNPHLNAANPPAVGPTKFRIYVEHGSVNQYVRDNKPNGWSDSGAYPVTDKSFIFGMYFNPTKTPPPAGTSSAVGTAGPAWLGFDMSAYPGKFAQPTLLINDGNKSLTNAKSATSTSWDPTGGDNINDQYRGKDVGLAAFANSWKRAGIYLGYCYSVDQSLSDCSPLIKNDHSSFYRFYSSDSLHLTNSGWKMQIDFSDKDFNLQLQYYDAPLGKWRNYEVLYNFKYGDEIYSSPFVDRGDLNVPTVASIVAEDLGHGDTMYGDHTFANPVPYQTENFVFGKIDPRTDRLNLYLSEQDRLEQDFDPAANVFAQILAKYTTAQLPYFINAYVSDPVIPGTTRMLLGEFANNVSQGNSSHYLDRDLVGRSADGFGWPGGDPQAGGVPGPTAGPSPTPPQANRPIMLNRPFQNVAELGYAFRDQPWKSVNFLATNSADSALLDLFCVGSTSAGNQPPPDIVAGKVSLNTAPAPVLQSLLAGANRLSPGDPSGTATPVSGSDAQNLATSLVSAATANPFQNISELPSVFPQDNSTSSTQPGNKIQREALVRALSGTTQTRTWNLLVDVVAQSGRYPRNNTSLDNFVVEGEKHYWLHVAIDRFTGEVIDEKPEPVNN